MKYWQTVCCLEFLLQFLKLLLTNFFLKRKNQHTNGLRASEIMRISQGNGLWKEGSFLARTSPEVCHLTRLLLGVFIRLGSPYFGNLGLGLWFKTVPSFLPRNMCIRLDFRSYSFSVLYCYLHGNIYCFLWIINTIRIHGRKFGKYRCV